MDMDPAERGGVEWVSEFFPVKGSSHRIKIVYVAHFIHLWRSQET